MLLALNVLARYGFNQRQLTEQDFFDICNERGIKVQFLDVLTSFYLSILGREVIVIDKKLTGVKRLFTMYHELFHSIWGARTIDPMPRAAFMGLCNSREEHEADAFACIALIPIEKMGDESFKDDCCCGFASDIYDRRVHLYNTYKI